LKSKSELKFKKDHKITTIGKFCPFEYGKGLPKKVRNQLGTIPVYGSNGIVGYHDVPLTKGSTIIIGRKGTIGSIHYSEIPCWPIDTSFFITKIDGINLKYAYYLLKNLNLKNMNSDSAVPGLNRNASHEIQIKIPLINKQNKIVEILGTLDDLIKNIELRNIVLLKYIQSIFKSWFIDFDGQTKFEDLKSGKIPKGWQTEHLDKIAVFLNGLALQKFRPKSDLFIPVIKIREMKNGFSKNSEKARADIEKKYIVNNGDVLFSWSASLEVTLWGSGKGALNQHIFKVTSEQYEKWFYYMWINFHLERFRKIAEGKATTMGHIQKHHLSEALVLIPTPKILQKMNNIMNPIIEQIVQNKIFIQNLSKIRDTFLPKLISGEMQL